MVSEVAGLAFESAFATADAIYEPVYRSADAQEGPRAFREKRRPVWQGR
jgi:enoyl-CoA hydratase/carnithine racemase